MPLAVPNVVSAGYAVNMLSNGDIAVAGQIEDSSDGHDIFVAEYSVATTPSSTYGYDVRNKMVGFSGATGTASYVYDNAGNRVRETTGGTASFYLTDTANPTGYAQPVEVWTSTNGSLSSATLNTTYLIGDRIFGQDVAGTLSYLQADGHGNTRLITNGTGTVKAALSYNAGGDVASSSGSASTIFEYPDGPLDPISGLRMPGDGTRDEEIAQGVFIERDFGKEGNGNNSNPITLNAELYGDGDPENKDDPSGHMALAYTAATAGAYADEEAMEAEEDEEDIAIGGALVQEILWAQLQLTAAEMYLIYASTNTGQPNYGDARVLSPGQLENRGIDAEALKEDYVPGQGSKYNVAVMPDGTIVFVPVQKGALPNVPTEPPLNIDEAPNLYPTDEDDE